MKRVFLSPRDQMMARLVAEETAKAIDAMLTARNDRVIERHREADAALRARYKADELAREAEALNREADGSGTL